MTIYRAGSNGNAPPAATISGGNTSLTAPQGIAVDSACNVYVSTQSGTPAIEVFGGALGNVALRTIANAGGGLYADTAHGALLSADFSGAQAFALGVNVSNSPQYAISGPLLVAPSAVAADSSGNVYVADNGGEQIVAYPMGGSSPLFSIAGANTGLSQPSGVALDGQNNVYAANAGANDVTMYARGLQGNVTPTATIVPPGGTVTGVAVDAKGYVRTAQIILQRRGGKRPIGLRRGSAAVDSPEGPHIPRIETLRRSGQPSPGVLPSYSLVNGPMRPRAMSSPFAG